MSDKNNHELTDKEIDQNTNRQIRSIFVEQLNGHCINEIEGPNASIIEFWQVQGKTVLVQRWPGAGWDYYTRGAMPLVENIAADIRAKLALD